MPRAPRHAASHGLASLRVRGVGLTVRGWWFLGAGAASFVIAYLGGREAFVFVGALLVALPLAAGVLAAVRRPRVEVTRSFAPRTIAAGSATSVALTVHNRAAGRSLEATWWDTVPWYPYVTAAGRLAALEPRSRRFAARNHTTVGYDLVPPHRGEFLIGPLSVLAGDAFGLATSLTVVGEPQPLIVTPEVVPLPSAGFSLPAGDGEATLVQRRAAGDEDDIMTREYRSGDAMRRVHWRASARHGDLMVRQEEQRSFPEARIIVDTTADAYADLSTEPTEVDPDSLAFEWVVRMLASAAVHLRRAGFLVSIEETGHPQLDGLGAGRRRTWGDEEFLARLASLELTDEPEERSTRSPGSTGPLIALLGTPSSETVEWMLARRRPGELAVAFTVQTQTALDRFGRPFGIVPEASAVAERLADEGWLVVPVGPDDDPAAAWQAIVAETGRGRA
ncbi:DUF58 domain-containing protein [Salinibacterium soli]|uniref:DUF58 domain-containing protein n=1 Tax=Antiquaquibacter soli TaxID=3064523 RepID=A0ABT9BNE9_9MICO|nr:DUF58 domain-containing protein [Protaetiibacter sp. WY-16]MDO7882540.1 DUF58 domain-containing protein [Protaetiibacter sp. WY-16]